MLLPLVNRNGHNYTSEQIHTEYSNGKKRMKTQRVVIHGNKGYKQVTVITNRKRKTSNKPLTKKEIECIRRCEYVPGLFKGCEECIQFP
jgi:hypothetical protein